MKVGTLNRTGKPYIGSYDIWNKNKISDLLDILVCRFTTPPKDLGPGGWVNGNKYVRSQESFGVLPIAEEVQTKLGMLVYHPAYASTLKIRYPYLAARQGTRTTVVPIHTKAERILFKMLVHEKDGLFAGEREPNWDTVAVRWAGHSDGINIFYKVSARL